MRKSFEENIHHYNDIAKSELAQGEGRKPAKDSPEDGELAELKTVLNWEVQKNAAARETSQPAQMEIYSLQRTKQNIFQKLKRDLALLDSPEGSLHWEKGSKKIVFEGGEYFLLGENGKIPLTAGEILTDGNWGLKYAPDESVPRDIRKKYLIETAKRKIRSRLDRQIYIDEIASKKTGEHVRGAYVRKFEEEELAGEMPPGILAEKMVDGLLKKMSCVPGVAFELIDSDVHLDVVKKIDFIIRRKTDYRGVKVEASGKQEEGIQFTVSQNRERIAEKETQVSRANSLLRPEDRLDKIILVSVAISHITDIYERWKSNPTPGGPEKLWDKETKKKIFERVLSDMLTPEELEKQWSLLESEV